MPNLLALETSSPVLSLAIKKGDSPVFEKSLEGYISHVEKLIPLLDEMLKEAKISLSEMDHFLMGRGPGSFTGVRVGFATLKALRIVQKKDCWGALSLDMIAENVSGENGDSLVVCLDARRTKIYTRFYERRENSWVESQKIELFSIDELIQKIPSGAFVTGDGLGRYQKEMEQAAPSKKWGLGLETTWYPKASTLIRFFEKQDLKLKKLEQPEDFIPHYIRLPEAEEKHVHVTGS